WTRTLAGEGKYVPEHESVRLFADNSTALPWLLAIDNPGEQWFEFEAELRLTPEGEKGTNQIGLFFGWRQGAQDPDSPYRFFVVELDEHPQGDDANGRLRLGSALITEGRGDRMAVCEWYYTFAARRPLGPRGGWHPVR